MIELVNKDTRERDQEVMTTLHDLKVFVNYSHLNIMSNNTILFYEN
jgi:ABC-type cobalamin/Fe3+-siderophores transport system ATPase subunit